MKLEGFSPLLYCLLAWELWISVLSWSRVTWVISLAVIVLLVLKRHKVGEGEEELIAHHSSLFDVAHLERMLSFLKKEKKILSCFC